MSFTPENLKKIFLVSLSDKEQSLMYGYLIEYIENLCEECVRDRMGNVLTPKCRRRFLINVRILCGSKSNELPEFCYSQVINNLKRYLDKKTTLYTPRDTYIYNEDLFELFFPKISNKLINRIIEDKPKEVDMLISKSKVPAIASKTRQEKPGLLRNILKKDKMIKEGSFIYDFNSEFFVIWADSTLYIAYLKKGYAICNVHKVSIESFEILKMILPLYAEGKQFGINLEKDANNIPSVKITISGSQLIQMDADSRVKKFSDIIEEISPKFPRATFNITADNSLEILVEIDKECTFDDLNFLFNTISKISTVENFNLLEEISQT